VSEWKWTPERMGEQMCRLERVRGQYHRRIFWGTFLGGGFYGFVLGVVITKVLS